MSQVQNVTHARACTEEGAQGGELDAEEIDDSGMEGAGRGEIGVVHERQCLTRFSGLLERTRMHFPAFS
jgi:hypothetical protein